MISTYIIDDEPHAIAVLKKYIEQTPGLVLSGYSVLPQQALADITSNPPDIAFIDIDMPLLSGIELAGLADPCTRVIFTTSFREYGAEAFEKNALDYLLKPIAYDRFAASVRKFKGDGGNSPAQDTFFVNAGTKGKLIRITFNDLYFIKSEQNYVSLYLSRETLLIDSTLQDILERLPAGKFFRVHRSYIIHMDKIKEISAGQVTLTSNAVIPIGRGFSENFYAFLQKSVITGKR